MFLVTLYIQVEVLYKNKLPYRSEKRAVTNIKIERLTQAHKCVKGSFFVIYHKSQDCKSVARIIQDRFLEICDTVKCKLKRNSIICKS